MFRPQTIAVFLSFAAHGLSIGCEYVGLDYFKDKPTGTITTQLDPLVEGQGFDIIDPYKCSFRFHTPQDRTATLENIQDFSDEFRNARITQSVWTETETTVAMTVDNPNNNGGTNTMLWLNNTIEAFQYAGLLRSGIVKPQTPRLNKPLGTVNILLPSGKNNVQSIPPPIYADRTEEENAELVHAKAAGIVGLAGEVDPAKDYAYAFTARLAEGLKHRYPKDVEDGAPIPAPTPLPYWEKYGPKFKTGPWLKAERGDGECVVIDLRRLEKYFKDTAAQTYSEVCDFPRAAKRELESMMAPVSWAA